MRPPRPSRRSTTMSRVPSMPVLGTALVALLAGPALAAPPAPRFGTFSPAEKAFAEAESRQAPPLVGHEWEKQISHDEETLLEEQSRMRQILRGGASDDNDTAHYNRGRTLVINIFINHSGGTWS